MEFKIGEKIVCIDPSTPTNEEISYTGSMLVKNEMYTVRDHDSAGVYLEGIICGYITSYPWTGMEAGWHPKRFRRCDYDFADQVIEMLKEETVEI